MPVNTDIEGNLIKYVPFIICRYFYFTNYLMLREYQNVPPLSLSLTLFLSLRFLHLGYRRGLTKFFGTQSFRYSTKIPSMPPSLLSRRKIFPFSVISNKQQIWKLWTFQCRSSGIGTDYRKEITLSIVFYWGFSQNKLCYWNNFF